jgi:hypothetical protein
MTQVTAVTAGNGFYGCARAHAVGLVVPAFTRYLLALLRMAA